MRRVPAGQQGRLRPLLGSTPTPAGQQQQQHPAAAAAAAASTAVPSQQQANTEAAAADEFGEDPFAQQAAALKAQQEAAQQSAAAAARQEQLQGGAAGGRGGRAGGLGGRGAGRGRGRSVPHGTYVCPRCSKIGHHWVSDCPTQGDPAFDVRHVRQPAGIPQGKITADPEGSILLPGGTLGQLTTNSKAYEQHVAQMMGTSSSHPNAAVAAGLEGSPADQPQLALEAGPAAATAIANGGSASQQQQQQQQQLPPSHSNSNEDEDDALQAAAQPVKLLALPAPSTASTAAAPSYMEDAGVSGGNTLVLAERSSLPLDLLHPFCTPKELEDQLPLLSAEGVLPCAAPRALLRAFGKGQPLTPSELEQLQAEERQHSRSRPVASTAAANSHHHTSSRHSRRGLEEAGGRSSKHRSHSHKRHHSSGNLLDFLCGSVPFFCPLSCVLLIATVTNVRLEGNIYQNKCRLSV